jgi:hypothetical protein
MENLGELWDLREVLIEEEVMDARGNTFSPQDIEAV